jgi:hypothetical protein
VLKKKKKQTKPLRKNLQKQLNSKMDRFVACILVLALCYTTVFGASTVQDHETTTVVVKGLETSTSTSAAVSMFHQFSLLALLPLFSVIKRVFFN